MKISSKRASLAAALFILGCQPADQELSAPTLDPSAYVTNWTEIFKNAIKKAHEKQVSVASLLGELGYVPGLAPKCSESELGSVGLDAVHLYDDLRRNEQSKGKRNKILLQGDPGIDLDARVQTLAYLIAQGDCHLVEGFNGRAVLLVDLKRLSEAATAKKLSFSTFLKVLRTFLDNHKNKAVFFLNDAQDAAFLGGSMDDVLKVFFEYDANVIIKSSGQRGPDFFSTAHNDRVYIRKLESMPSQTVVAALEAMVQAQVSSKAVKISARTNEDIVRLSRAFFSANGALTVALQVFNLVAAYAEASANKTADASMVAQAVLELNEKFRAHDNLSMQIVKETKAWTDPLSIIDSNVAKTSRFYAGERVRVGIEDPVVNSLFSK